jgi:hypothetical protein
MTREEWLPCASCSVDDEYAYVLWMKKAMVVIERETGKVIYLRRDQAYMDSLRAFGQFIQWKAMNMELRWNPKPSCVFTRAGVGTIAVIGKEILQFDAAFKLIFRKETLTFYQAVQEAMLLVGAVVSDHITEEVDLDIDPGPDQ